MMTIKAGDWVLVEVLDLHRWLGVYDANSYLRTAIQHGSLDAHCLPYQDSWRVVRHTSEGTYRVLFEGSREEASSWLSREYGVLGVVLTPFGSLVPRRTQQVMRRALRQMMQQWS